MSNLKKIISGWRKDLGFQIFMQYILFLLPILVYGGIFDYLSGQRLRQDVMAADLSLSRAIAQETDTILTSALYSVEKLGYYPGVLELNEEEMRSLFGEFYTIRLDVNLVYRLDAEGTMVFHFPEGPSTTRGQDFSFRDYYKEALTTTDPIISLGRISPTTEQAVATAVIPLWENGEFLGLVGTNMRLSSFSETLSSIAKEYRPDQQFEVLILDAGGKVIAHPKAEKLLLDVNDLFSEISEEVHNGEEGSFIKRNKQGIEYIYSVVQIPKSNWAVLVSRPTAVAFTASNSLHRSLLVFVFVFAGTGLFFWQTLSRRMLKPIESLTSYTRAIGSDEKYSADALNSISHRQDQLGYLTRSFQSMHSDVQDRIGELSVLLETSAAVVSTLDSKDVLIRILEQVERLLGFNMSAIIAQEDNTNNYHAVSSLGLSPEYAENIQVSLDEPGSITMRSIKIGKLLQVNDENGNSDFDIYRERGEKEGYSSFVSIPLNTVHANPAALVVYSPNPRPFSKREIELLSNFANHATMAIENAELYSRSDASLQEEKRRLESLIDSMESGLLLEDLDGNILYANRLVYEMVGKSLDELIGKPIRLFYRKLLENTQDADKVRVVLEDYIKNDKKRFSVDIAFDKSENQQVIRMQGFVVTDSEERVIGRGQFLRDISRRLELDRMKSSLIATTSHELRTPLAAIKGYATTLLAEDVEWDRKSQKEFLEIISMEADRLGELVYNLLDMSRIEAGDLTLSRMPTNIAPMIDFAINRAYPQPNRDLLTIEIPNNLKPIYVDGPRIEVVLRNLIENAVKYGGKNSPINIRVISEDDEVQFYIEDNGPGIPAIEKKKVFSSFYRMEKHRSEHVSGVGLGLSISRGFILAHKGRIWFEPTEKGTCVAFALPLNINDDEDEKNIIGNGVLN
jgi:PAS domain S-box-containing protein